MPVIKSKIMQKRSLHPHSRKKSSQKQQSHKPQVNQEHDFLPSKKSSSGQYKETKTRDTSYVFATPIVPLQYIYKKRQKNDHSTYTFRNFKTHITIAPTTSNDHTVDERNVIHSRLTNNLLQPATYYGN